MARDEPICVLRLTAPSRAMAVAEVSLSAAMLYAQPITATTNGYGPMKPRSRQSGEKSVVWHCVRREIGADEG